MKLNTFGSHNLESLYVIKYIHFIKAFYLKSHFTIKTCLGNMTLCSPHDKTQNMNEDNPCYISTLPLNEGGPPDISTSKTIIGLQYICSGCSLWT